MLHHSIGTDIVQIPRIKNTWKRFSNRFSQKLLHPQELEEFAKVGIFERQYTYLAKKFASKEAISKALGVGIGNKLGFKDIVIWHNNLGAPQVKIEQVALLNLFPRYDHYNISLSISDDYPVCVACALLTIEITSPTH